jgi:hypothetical protein
MSVTSGRMALMRVTVPLMVTSLPACTQQHACRKPHNYACLHACDAWCFCAVQEGEEHGGAVGRQPMELAFSRRICMAESGWLTTRTTTLLASVQCARSALVRCACVRNRTCRDTCKHQRMPNLCMMLINCSGRHLPGGSANAVQALQGLALQRCQQVLAVRPVKGTACVIGGYILRVCSGIPRSPPSPAVEVCEVQLEDMMTSSMAHVDV